MVFSDGFVLKRPRLTVLRNFSVARKKWGRSGKRGGARLPKSSNIYIYIYTIFFCSSSII